MRISDWSSDVCSSDLSQDREIVRTRQRNTSCPTRCGGRRGCEAETCPPHASCHLALIVSAFLPPPFLRGFLGAAGVSWNASWRSEEHTSELQSLMRISYAVFCLKKKMITKKKTNDRPK